MNVNPKLQHSKEPQLIATTSRLACTKPIVSRSQFKPMLFSTPMVQAILDGSKSQTRREIKMSPKNFDNHLILNKFYGESGREYIPPYGKIGDIIWVRETFTIIDWWEDSKAVQIMYEDAKTKVVTLTDNEWAKFDKWAEKSERKPSLFLFKSLSRIHLKVTDIKVERLQDITDNDCIAEGILKVDGMFKRYSGENKNWLTASPNKSYKSLWQSINKNWDDNPFVWVISFNRVECPQGCS